MPHLQPHDAPPRFGIFLPPMHKTGVNPTLALHRDLELIEHLDRLGYAEAWIGEHHSAGSELIASPEVLTHRYAACSLTPADRAAARTVPPRSKISKKRSLCSSL